MVIKYLEYSFQVLLGLNVNVTNNIVKRIDKSNWIAVVIKAVDLYSFFIILLINKLNNLKLQ